MAVDFGAAASAATVDSCEIGSGKSAASLMRGDALRSCERRGGVDAFAVLGTRFSASFREPFGRRLRISGAIRVLTITPGALHDLAQTLPHFGVLAELLGEDVARAQQGIGPGGNLPIDAGVIGRPGVELRAQRIGFQNFPRQFFQPAAAGGRGQRLLLGLERQVEILEPLRRRRGENLLGELLGQLALRLDRTQDRLLALGKLTHLRQPVLNDPNLLFIQTAGLILAVSGDKGDRVPFIEQFNGGLNLF